MTPEQVIQERDKEFDKKFNQIDYGDDICDIKEWNKNIKSHNRQTLYDFIDSITGEIKQMTGEMRTSETDKILQRLETLKDNIK